MKVYPEHVLINIYSVTYHIRSSLGAALMFGIDKCSLYTG